ncbi:MAG: chorismate mutase [Ferroplasma sp.]|uniref:chorismate mutase n=1 Tax=Ferroplasma sp. TaxID=2591003 RepID=UPI0028162046|nr:chorismate mutase [Ferroplasma sp.]WMT52076.1 MAG: chorismate mutase [Ferroplasma sp.]
MKFINELDNLRDEIYLNSKKILELLEKRRELAGKIGEIKNSENMDIRNRAREIDILKTLSRDPFEEFVLNVLFEFSIHYEKRGTAQDIKFNYSDYGNGLKYIKYSGNHSNLIFLLSKILNPGSIIKCMDVVISNMMAQAGHHIVDYIEKPDIVINLNSGIPQDIEIATDYILISERFMININSIYKIVIE